MTNRCRNCHADLKEPVLTYENMPSLSQKLPKTPEHDGITLQVCECPACGLVQLANEPVHYYREVIRAVGVSQEMAEFRHGQFRDYFDKYKLDGKRFFEVGCGEGEYLKLLQTASPESRFCGIESGDPARARAQQAGFEVSKLCFELGDEKIPGGPFDGFFIFNYLEHLPDLPVVLKGIGENLRPGGYGLVEVPNFDWMLREHLFTEFTIDHLFYFTEKTLRRTLEMHGFDVLSCSCVRYDYILCAEVQKRRGQQFDAFGKTEKKLFAELHEFCRPFSADEVAVWGAGHQAFAVLASAGLEKKIGKIIDSAPFKQGCFSPATGIPIVAPDTLDSDRTRAIMIMAGSYCDEVADIIRKRYPGRFKLGILRGDHLENA